MKYFALVALIAATNAIRIDNAPYGLIPDCEYHKSEDLSECVKIVEKCNPTTPAPVLEKCPVRAPPSERTEVAPKNPEIQSNAAPPAAGVKL